MGNKIAISRFTAIAIGGGGGEEEEEGERRVGDAAGGGSIAPFLQSRTDGWRRGGGGTINNSDVSRGMLGGRAGFCRM